MIPASSGCAPVELQLVPAHMRNLERLVLGRRSPPPRPRIQPRPSVVCEFEPARRHQLHADADAEKGPRFADDRLFQRRAHAGHGHEPALAIGEGADAGQHDAVGRGHHLGVAGHLDVGRKPRLARRALERLRGRAQIARAVIDQRRESSETSAEHALGRGNRRSCARVERNRLAQARAPGPCSRTRRYGGCSRRRDSRHASVTPADWTKAWNHSLNSSRVHLAELGLGELHLPDQIGPVRGVERHPRQGLVHRHQRLAPARDALAVAQRLGHRLADDIAGILGGVVVIDVQIALGLELEVDQAVARRAAPACDRESRCRS